MTAQHPTAKATGKAATAPTRRWLGFFAVLAAMIMNLLDSTIVNVAAPSIRAELGGSYASLQWMAAAYPLALAVGLLTGGRLGDMYGRRRMLMVGAAGFVTASLAAAAAPSPEVLIGTRVVQGLFGAVMIPQAFGLIRDLFGPKDIGKAFAALGPVIGLSTIAGPIVAGLLVDADILGMGWRSIFAINLPIGGFTLLAGRVALPSVRTGGTGQRPARLDLTGTLLAATGMFLLVYPLVQGAEAGWPAWTFAMLTGAIVTLAGFAAHQHHRTRTGRTPLVQLSVLAKRSYTSGVLFVVVFFGAIAGLALVLGLFLQLGLGYSPIRASLTMATWALGAFLGSGFAAAAGVKLGRRVVHLGLGIMSVGITGLYLVFNVAGSVGAATLALPLAAFGLGMGMIFVPLFDIIMGEIADHEVGSAAGLLESIQQLGGSVGVAALGTVFFATTGAPTVQGHFAVAAATDAAAVTALAALALTGVAFALGFLLPKAARPQPDHAPVAEEEAPATTEAAPMPAAA
jgi:EmrB/QacA subfamily drug resistance transporter